MDGRGTGCPGRPPASLAWAAFPFVIEDVGLFAVGATESWLQLRSPIQGEGEFSKWPTLSGQPLEAGVRPVEPVGPQHHFADDGLHLLPLEEHRVLRGASRGHLASRRTCWGVQGLTCA